MVEILAPAGDFECLKAGVLNGANAVYIGGKEFSARQFAGNFDREEMIEAIRFCHSYGVKVYVTMNTLYNNEELLGALTYAAFLYENGADALIIQDMGFLKLLKEQLPGFEIHGSTQMTVHNVDGVNILYNMGVKRVVLARELSMKEIEYIARNTKAEIEVFVHGALCISFSGQCLFSSMLGGRSGNRGRCAQSCRQEYTFEDGTKGYLLSPKDLSTLKFVKEISKTGITSIKIEGRMKKPEYVSGVVSAYKRALIDKTNEDDIEKITQLFNRGGFTTHHMFERPGYDMMSYKRPKNWGMKLGEVIKSNHKFATIKLVRELNLNDGVENFNRGNGALVSKIWCLGKEVEHGDIGDAVEIYLENSNRGDEIYKSLDIKIVKNEEESYKGKIIKQMPLYGEFTALPNKELVLKILSKDGVTATAYGKIPEIAIKTATTDEMARRSLMKTKDTPFYFDKLNIHLGNGLSIPVSELNSMRRLAITDIIDKLQNKREKVQVSLEIKNKKTKIEPKLVCITGSLESAKGAIDSGIDIVFFGGDELRINNGRIQEVIEYNNGRATIMPWLPEIMIEEYEGKSNWLSTLNNNYEGMLCGNLGMLSKLETTIDKSKFKIFLTSGFNIFNSVASEVFDNVVPTVSKELNFKQIKDLISKTKSETMVIIHGKTKIMVSRHCFIGSIKGHGKTGCPNLCINQSHYITDKIGERFQIVPDKNCRNHIYNSKILCTIEHMRDIINMNANYLALEFLDESYSDAKEIVHAYKKQLKASVQSESELIPECRKIITELDGRITKGHFNRGVE